MQNAYVYRRNKMLDNNLVWTVFDGNLWPSYRQRRPAAAHDPVDPVRGLYEYCSATRLASPAFEFVSSSEDPFGLRHTVRCQVHVGPRTYCSEGVSRTKRAAKKLAARSVLDRITAVRRYPLPPVTTLQRQFATLVATLNTDKNTRRQVGGQTPLNRLTPNYFPTYSEVCNGMDMIKIL